MQNGKGNKIIDKIDKLKRRLDIRDKVERRRNVIKNVEVREMDRRKPVEEILGVVRVKVVIEEV